MASCADDFYIRVAEPGDSSALEASFRFSTPRSRAGIPDFLKLMSVLFPSTSSALTSLLYVREFHSLLTYSEDSLYSFLALSSDDEVTAFAAFNDVPYMPAGEFGKRAVEARAWAMDMSSSHGFSVENSLWLKLCCMSSLDSSAEEPDTSVEEKYLKGFISAIFKLSPQTHAILALSTLELIKHGFLKPLCSSEEMGFSLSLCLQSMVLPSFNVKKAVVEYYDDLWPIVECARRKGSVLSTIPDSAMPAYPYAVARLIAAQDAYNTVLVAEVDNELVGLIAITTTIDPKFVQNFQLDTYDGLISSQENEAFVSHSPNESKNEPNNEDPQLNDHIMDASICQEKTKNVQNAFQITMFCLEEASQYRAIDILIAAFAYEGKDFCMVEVPYDNSLPEFFQYFTCVRKNESISREEDHSSLYILHRHSLIHGFEVQLLKSQEILLIKHLLRDVEDSDALIDQLELLRKRCCAFVATYQNEVVGFALVDNECPTEALFSHFDLRSFVNINRQHEGIEAVMLYFVVGSIFANRRKYFLREIMRQLGKNVLFFPVFSSQHSSDLIKDMYFVPGRWHSSMSPPCIWWQPSNSSLPGQRSVRLSQYMQPQRTSIRSGALSKFGEYFGFDCALFMMTHWLFGRQRLIKNSRIVFVGASQTAASCLNTLISDADLKFCNLTLVSSYGLKSLSANEKVLHDVEQGPSDSFRKSGVDYLVNVVADKVTGFDRKAKYIILSSGKRISYDYLILTTGLQDQTRNMLKIDRDKGVFRIDELLVMVEDNIICLNATEMKAPIIIYGLSLETFTAFQFLLSRGIPGHLLVLVYPEFETLESFAEMCFGDRDISMCVVTELRQAGITTRPGLRLLGVNSRGLSNFLESVLLEDLHKEEGDSSSSDAENGACETGTANHIVQPCMFLVTCASKHVDHDIVQAFMKEGIVYNGKIVVEENFQTNDPFIFACGSAAKFSRNCGRQLNMEAYNSCELGRSLANAIISLFCRDMTDQHKGLGGPLSYAFEATDHFPRNLRLMQAKGVGTLLPGNSVYFHLNCPAESSSDLAVVKPFIMKKDGVVLRIELQNGEIRKIIYFGHHNLDAWKLIRIVGCYEPLINALVCSPNKGSFNLVDFFSQPWFGVVFHDKFHEFYNEICLESMRIWKDSLSDEELVKGVISDGFVIFLNAYKSDFPGLGIKNTSANELNHLELKRNYSSSKVLKEKMRRNMVGVPNCEETEDFVPKETLPEGMGSILKSRGKQDISVDADQNAEKKIQLDFEAATQVSRNETEDLMVEKKLTEGVSSSSESRGEQECRVTPVADRNAEMEMQLDLEAVMQVSRNETCDQMGISDVTSVGISRENDLRTERGHPVLSSDQPQVKLLFTARDDGYVNVTQLVEGTTMDPVNDQMGMSDGTSLGGSQENDFQTDRGHLVHSSGQPLAKLLLTARDDDYVNVTLSAEGTSVDPVNDQMGMSDATSVGGSPENDLQIERGHAIHSSDQTQVKLLLTATHS